MTVKWICQDCGVSMDDELLRLPSGRASWPKWNYRCPLPFCGSGLLKT